MTARKNCLLSTIVFFIEDVTMLAAYVPILAMLGIALFIAVFVITLSRFWAGQADRTQTGSV
jgi:hypothetical protein